MNKNKHNWPGVTLKYRRRHAHASGEREEHITKNETKNLDDHSVCLAGPQSSISMSPS